MRRPPRSTGLVWTGTVWRSWHVRRSRNGATTRRDLSGSGIGDKCPTFRLIVHAERPHDVAKPTGDLRPFGAAALDDAGGSPLNGVGEGSPFGFTRSTTLIEWHVCSVQDPIQPSYNACASERFRSTALLRRQGFCSGDGCASQPCPAQRRTHTAHVPAQDAGIARISAGGPNLVQALAQQIEGTLSLNRKRGTRWALSFPCPLIRQRKCRGRSS